MADHTTNWILKLGDQVSGPLGKIVSVQNSVVNKVHQITDNIHKLSAAGSSTATSLTKMNTVVSKMPHSISELKNKLSDLYGQLETTHSYKSLHNLQKEIAKTKAQLNTLETGTVGKEGVGIGAWVKKGLAFAAAYIGVGQALGFAKDSLHAYDEEAKVRAQLEAGIKSTHGISGQTSEGLEQKAIGRQKITLFRADDTMLAQSQLLVFDKVRGKVFDDAIVAAQDLSTKMKIDLPEATRMMGKALQDPVHGMRMLRMAGISFSDGQLRNIRKLMEQGDLYKVQLAILKGMQDSYGGSAVAAAKAGIGPTQILINKIHTLKEAFGESLTPTVNHFSGVFGRLVEKFTDFVKIPVSTKINEEIASIISLQGQLSSANISEQQRHDILTKLKDIEPDITKGIREESIDYRKLSENINVVLDGLYKKIKLSALDEQGKKAISDLTDYTQEAGNIVGRQFDVINSKIDKNIINRRDLSDLQKLQLAEGIAKERRGTLKDTHNVNTPGGVGQITVDVYTEIYNSLHQDIQKLIKDQAGIKLGEQTKKVLDERTEALRKAMEGPKSTSTSNEPPKIPMGEGDGIGSLDKNGKMMKDKDGNFINNSNDVTSGTSRGSGSGGSKSIVVNLTVNQNNHLDPGNYEKKKDEMKKELVGVLVDAASDAAILAGE